MESQSIMSQIVAIVAPLLVGLVAGVLTWLLKRLDAWIKAKIESKTLESALLQINEAVGATVNDLEKEVRIYISDGKLTREEAKRLKDIARDRIFSLAPAALDRLAKAGFQQLEEYIGGKIEEKVAEFKTPSTGQAAGG